MGFQYSTIQDPRLAIRPLPARQTFTRLGRPPATARGRLLAFAVIGAVCTALFALCYGACRTFTGPLASNAVALALTVLVNFLGNRQFTFGAHRGPIRRQALQYAVVYLFGLAISTVVLDASLRLLGHPGRAFEIVVALASGGVATVIRFVLLSAWVFPVLPPAPVTSSLSETEQRNS